MAVPINIKSELSGVSNFSDFLLLVGSEAPWEEETVWGKHPLFVIVRKENCHLTGSCRARSGMRPETRSVLPLCTRWHWGPERGSNSLEGLLHLYRQYGLHKCGLCWARSRRKTVLYFCFLGLFVCFVKLTKTVNTTRELVKYKDSGTVFLGSTPPPGPYLVLMMWFRWVIEPLIPQFPIL